MHKLEHKKKAKKLNKLKTNKLKPNKLKPNKQKLNSRKQSRHNKKKSKDHNKVQINLQVPLKKSWLSPLHRRPKMNKNQTPNCDLYDLLL